VLLLLLLQEGCHELEAQSAYHNMDLFWADIMVPTLYLLLLLLLMQERCRELEAQLADLSMDLQELTSALSRVEADVAASADEKQLLRREYERKIEAVVKQMAGLQQQMQQQVGAFGPSQHVWGA
jgi:hypothetical protein